MKIEKIGKVNDNNRILITLTPLDNQDLILKILESHFLVEIENKELW